MKTMPYIVAVVFSLFIMTPVSAQNSPRAIGANADPSNSLSTNFRLSLSAGEENSSVLQMSFVVASNTFQVSSPDGSLRFSGNLEEKEDSSFILRYGLAMRKAVETSSVTTNNEGKETTAKNIHFQDSECTSSAILILDQPLDILTMGDRTFTLKISKATKK